jgi:hypothetical protein
MGIGIALGGVAQGLESGLRAGREREELALRQRTILQDAELRKRALGIQEAQEQRLAKHDVLAKADKIIGDELKIVSDTIKAGKQAGHSAEQISAAIEPLLKDVDRLSAAVGSDSSIYRKNVDAMLTGPTAAEAAASQGSLEAGKKLSEGRRKS